VIDNAEVETMNRWLHLIGFASVAAIIGCANPALADTIDIGGATRTYTAQLPETKPAPLVIVLHGNTQTGADIVERPSWPQVAKREGFGVVFPDGLNRAWADLRGSDGAPAGPRRTAPTTPPSSSGWRKNSSPTASPTPSASMSPDSPMARP
jgi:poly(3-hydroxybutyrate) depolymerase